MMVKRKLDGAVDKSSADQEICNSDTSQLYVTQARNQKILLGSAFEEIVDLLILQYSPGKVEEFIIVRRMFIAHIYEGFYY